jgi:pimeloyl-ACP methyl ester carboxylesterase
MASVVRRVAVGVLLLMVGAGTPVSTARAGSARLVDRDCAVPVPAGVDATCSWLVVPEDRARPGRGTVRLAVMVLHSRATRPEPDPVVFLAGGPGGPGIEGFESFLDSPMLEHRDLVLFDQRGTGMSEPLLDCPERAAAMADDFRHADPHDEELDRLREATRACRDRLLDEEIDLDAFDTVASAADLADLREALDVEEWNLYGTSYGTRLALETMRSHPAGIRSVVLDSVYPTDRQGLAKYVSGFDAAFDRLVEACEADPDCAALQPDLGGLIDQVADRYNSSPVDVPVAGGDSFIVNGADVIAGLWDAMSDSEIIPALPSIIQSLASGDTGILSVFADTVLADGPAEGMFLSVECADNATSPRDVRVADDPGRAEVVVRYAAEPYCAMWDVDPLPASFRRPVRSRIPVIVFAGSLDPITPASDSEHVADLLRNAVYVELAGLGHVVTKVSDCAREIRQEFLDAPEAPPDLSCADAPAPPFLSQGLI